ncbi:MAG TPA: anaerobic ribonucleoside-triphosphate reductase [Planctomycetota bacterium]|nr:anaerobic ribonucleoside-triphosphate reductase [Planctomycetota bacterium]
MAIRKIESVRKRDGTLAPYDEQKIADAIARAARTSGHDNATIGRDLASVVTMYLERYREKDTPSSEEIQQLVEKILFDTGHGAIARAYIVHREKKGSPVQAAPAQPPQEDLFPTNLVRVDGATRGEVTPWSRDKITAALSKEAGLEETAAREIATAVEQKIFRLGQGRVSTTLIRELVNHELIARGYGSKMKRQIVVGLPKYDLGRLVDEERGIDPDHLCRTIGQTTLKQYALQEIFPRDVADAHVEGRIHIHRLEEPLKLHALSPCVREIRRSGVRVRGSAALSEPARDARTLTAQLGRIAADAARIAAGPVAFANLSEAYDQLLWGASDDAVHAEIEHLAAAVEGASTTVHPRHRSALGIARLGRCAVAVESCGEELREFCRAAADRGMVFALERASAPGTAVASSGWGGTAQAVTLNLPQAFYRSEAGTDFYTELETAIDVAVRAHLQKRQLLRRFADRGSDTLGLALGWMADGAGALRLESLDYAVGLAGLNESVKLLLSGEEIHQGDGAVRLALRIVSYVYFRLREEGSKHALRLVLQDVAPDDALSRFARIDGQMYPRARGLLADRAAYTPGFRARGTPSFETLALEARFHTLVPSARAVVERGRLSPADLYSMLGRAHAETLASNVAVE